MLGVRSLCNQDGKNDIQAYTAGRSKIYGVFAIYFTLGFTENMKLRVFASLSEDINNGWVWLPESIVPKRIVVKVRNLNSKKSVYCEALPIGKNFVTRYNRVDDTIEIKNSDSCIVLNEWYREKLDIKSTQTEHDFKVTTADNPYGHFKASLAHPQIVVRLAMELAIVGLVLGIISLWK